MATREWAQLAVRTRGDADAGSKSRFAVVGTVPGTNRDEFYEVSVAAGRGQGRLYDLSRPLRHDDLARLVMLGADQWRLEDALLWDRVEKDPDEYGVGVPHLGDELVPIGAALDIQQWLSTDVHEGRATLPLRPVAPGDRDMPIDELAIVARTQRGEDKGTDSRLVLQITDRSGDLVLDYEIPDTPQADLNAGTTCLYPRIVPTRGFCKADLEPTSIRLTITGEDAWYPERFIVLGFELESRVNAVPPLQPARMVTLTDCAPDPLSTDRSEGAPSRLLPLDQH